MVLNFNMNSPDIQSVAKRVIKIEAEAVSLIGERIDAQFESATLRISSRLIVDLCTPMTSAIFDCV